MSESVPLTQHKRIGITVAAFFAWMFAGLENSLFILIHRQMLLTIGEPGLSEGVITRWFAWFQAAFLFGAAAGGWLFGWLGDRSGRTRALGLAVLCYSLFTLICFWANQTTVMLILRFLACLGIGGVWPNAVALVAEAWPSASRPFLAGLLGAAANVGFVLLGTLAYFVEVTPESWRWVLLVGACPSILGIVILLVVPESPRWIASQQVTRTTSDSSSIREVLRPPLLSRTVFGILLGAVPVIGTAANANWLVPWTDHMAEKSATEKKKVDSRSKAKTQIMRSSGATIGSLFGGVIASLLGRRVTYFLISLLAFGVSTFIFTQLNPLHPQFQLSAFILGLVGVAYFGWLPLFLPEMFPTRVRSTGSGITFNTGRIVAAIVVLSAGFLLGQFGGDYAAVGLWSGMIYAVGMIIIWFAPRRVSDQLED